MAGKKNKPCLVLLPDRDKTKNKHYVLTALESAAFFAISRDKTTVSQALDI